MILSKTVKIKVSASNCKNLLKCGYKFNKQKDEIEIKVEHLTRYSCTKIQCICDVCKSIIEIEYIRYMNSFEKHGIFACSPKCGQENNKLTNLARTGFDHNFKNPASIEKKKILLLNTMVLIIHLNQKQYNNNY